MVVTWGDGGLDRKDLRMGYINRGQRFFEFTVPNPLRIWNRKCTN